MFAVSWHSMSDELNFCTQILSGILAANLLLVLGSGALRWLTLGCMAQICLLDEVERKVSFPRFDVVIGCNASSPTA